MYLVAVEVLAKELKYVPKCHMGVYGLWIGDRLGGWDGCGV